jgi:glycosyltransferase involved in cell wall biosynthesis
LVVTAYYKEPKSVLARCIDSVRAQTIATDHLLVADGFPQDWIDQAGVRHLRLDRSHADWGDTPRGIGCLLGVAEGYDAIALLDADCWLEPDHVELSLATAAKHPSADFIVAVIINRRPDGSAFDVPQAPHEEHVDTNAFFFLPRAYRALALWLHIPSAISAAGDRVFYQGVKALGLRFAVNPRPTTNYVCTWASVYALINEEPPAGAKPNPDYSIMQSWLRELTEAQHAELCARLQFNVREFFGISDGPSADSARQSAVSALSAVLPTAVESTWCPSEPSGGTELMERALRAAIPHWVDKIDLYVNRFDRPRERTKPQVMWIHHDINVKQVQWLSDAVLRDSVDCFVFVSEWQKARFIKAYSVLPSRALVLPNATNVPANDRPWSPGPLRRFAYTSTPFRGLSVLLAAWREAALDNAELHIWSSVRLYGSEYFEKDQQFEPLYAMARSLQNVVYHGVVPNEELRQSLRMMDFLAYPCTFDETSCLAVIEAMSAGCRVICSSRGALPETAHGFAREYIALPDEQAHARQFAALLRSELSHPWLGASQRALEQQAYARAKFDWSVRAADWRSVIGALLHVGRRSDR